MVWFQVFQGLDPKLQEDLLSIPTWSDFKNTAFRIRTPFWTFQSQHGLISRKIFVVIATFLVTFQSQHGLISRWYARRQKFPGNPFNPNMVWFQVIMARSELQFHLFYFFQSQHGLISSSHKTETIDTGYAFNPNMVWFQGDPYFLYSLTTI